MSSILQLQRGTSKAEFLPGRGGLLHRLILTAANGAPTSLLWLPTDFQSDATSWPGGGVPLCFPFAGRVWHQGEMFKYALNGRVYPMPLHGFAYSLPWRVTQQEEHAAVLELSSNPTSRSLFPYDFRLTCRYTLSPNAMHCAIDVQNKTSDAAMPVALGLHPFFSCPIVPGLQGNERHPWEGGALETSAQHFYGVTNIGAAGKINSTASLGTADVKSPGTITIPLTEPRLRSLILTDSSRAEITLKDPARAQRVTVSWSSCFNHVVLWSNPEQGFFCMEPWMSLPDALQTPSGLQWLQPDEHLQAQVTITLLG